MQIRSARIYGLEPIDDDTPLRTVVAWVLGVASVPLILAAAYVLGAPATRLPPPRGHLDGHYAGHLTTSAATSLDPSIDAVPPQAFAQVTPEQALAINASIPMSLAPNPAAPPFRLVASDPVDQLRAQTCLTLAVYYEAASQGDEGEAAVAQVVLNRLRNPVFPKTICGVVFQGSTLPTGCQFTFTCDGSLNRPANPAGWKRASQVAERALGGYVEPLVGQATHYHTVWVVPSWQSTVDKVAQIGAHIFYRWSGPRGRLGAFGFAYAGAEPLPPNVHGFDFGPTVSVATEATSAPVVAEPEAPAAPRAIVPGSQAASAVTGAAAVAVATPVLPSKLDTGPAALPAVNPQGDSRASHRLAVPASW
jgi:spore germination cell wall hydrolase CwlJ-like protein